MSDPFEDALIALLNKLASKPPNNWSDAAARRSEFGEMAKRLHEIQLGRRMQNDQSPYDLSGRREG